MLHTLEAVIEQDGTVRLLQAVELPESRRALVVVLDEEPILPVPETALLSERALADGWDRPEEDAAWSHLQQGQLS